MTSIFMPKLFRQPALSAHSAFDKEVRMLVFANIAFEVGHGACCALQLSTRGKTMTIPTAFFNISDAIIEM